MFHSQIKLKQNKIKLNLFLYFFIVFSFIRIIRLFPIVLLEIFASSVLKLLSHINAAALGPNEPNSPQKKATRWKRWRRRWQKKNFVTWVTWFWFIRFLVFLVFLVFLFFWFLIIILYKIATTMVWKSPNQYFRTKWIEKWEYYHKLS